MAMLKKLLTTAVSMWILSSSAFDVNDVAKFRAGNSCYQCDLRYEINFRKQAPGGDFRGAYMFNVNFYKSNFVDSDFQSANLIQADLNFVDFSRANMNKIVMRLANLTGATGLRSAKGLVI
jgi:uncharacterized protein YjbI with pentapeptide repeats